MVLSKRYLDQWDRIGDSEIDSHVFGARKTIYLYIVFLEKNQFWLLPHIMKIEMYLDLIVKTKIVIFLGGIIRENPCNIRIGKYFLY